MDIRRRNVGITAGHAKQGPTQVDEYVIDNGSGLSVTAWTYGATLVEVAVPDRTGRLDNIIVRLPTLADYENRAINPYVGATLGRYARCVSEGQFMLDGIKYQLTRNHGRHHFHGGAIGFDRFVWEASVEREPDAVILRLHLDRPDGDEGYPGTLSAEVSYRIHSSQKLTIEYRAATTASTIVALSNHAYWNLGGGGLIDRHRIAVNASRVVAVDDELVPCGPLLDVNDCSSLDYREPRIIGGKCLDCCFVLQDSTWAADLSDLESGRRMRVVTDQPGLAVYSGEILPRPRSGLSLQTGALPNSPNREDFPSSRLDAGAVYRHWTTFEFSVQ